MTEIPEKSKLNEYHIIDPVAFFGALILAPLLVTALTFWVAYIPVAALIFGAPFYLALGTPVLMWHLARNAPNATDIAGLAMATVAIAAGCLTVLAILAGQTETVHVILAGSIFGLIFAPVWGGTFGWLYIRMRREFFAQPV